MQRNSRAQLSGTPSLPSLLGAYKVSFIADHERISEERRLQNKIQEQQRRRQDRSIEKLRQQVIKEVFMEARHQHQPIEIVAFLEKKKRLKAFDSVQRAQDKYEALRSDPRRRNYDATPQLREHREAEFQRRRSEDRLQREARREQIQAVERVRSAFVSATGELRLQRARDSASQFQQQRTAQLVAGRVASEERTRRAREAQAASQPQLRGAFT